MEEKSKSLYIKRTQRDYPMSFKLAVVREVESGAITNNGAMRKYGIQGHGTIVEWRRKFGNFEVGNTVTQNFMKSPQQKIAELEQKVRLLERQNAFLQQELEDATDKAGILDKIIEIAEEELHLPIRKNCHPSSRKVLQRAKQTDRSSLPTGRGITPEVLSR